MPHSIRLRGPWQFQTLASPTPHTTGRIELPGDLSQVVAEYEGTVRFSRRFHEPTGLDPGTRVELVLTGLPPDSQIDLGGRITPIPNPPPADFRLDITAQLSPLNQLTLEFPLSLGQQINIDIRLDIHSSSET